MPTLSLRKSRSDKGGATAISNQERLGQPPGAAAASVEQLGTGALKRDIFTDVVENGLAFIDLVTSGGDEK